MKETNDKIAVTKLLPPTLNARENSTKRISYKVTAWIQVVKGAHLGVNPGF